MADKMFKIYYIVNGVCNKEIYVNVLEVSHIQQDKINPNLYKVHTTDGDNFDTDPTNMNLLRNAINTF